MANEKTPLIAPSPAGGDEPTAYFVGSVRSKSLLKGSVLDASADAEEVETLPEGSVASNFEPRPITQAGVARAQSLRSNGAAKTGWFGNIFAGQQPVKSSGAPGDDIGSLVINRKVPVKVDPKVFFANERTFLAWLHVSVILAGASVAIVAFTESKIAGMDQLYGVILLPVSIAFIVYAMVQYARRASMIRHKMPGPYVDIMGPTSSVHALQ
eukprot:scaffold3800_cov77-Cyclotella_meneghiniana.AAC.1